MAPKFPASLEDTISTYKNKYLIDLDDENDEVQLTVLHDESTLSKDESTSSATTREINLRTETGEESDGSERRKSRLPRDLAGLMGQANVNFARGDYENAIPMCQEVIRLAPKCPDPFISLAEYYSECDDEEKAEQLYLIAAYLQPSNTHLWEKVAESATRRREFRLAASCYTKAIRADKNDACISYHLRRCNLYEKLGDQKKALKGYESLLSLLGRDDEQFGLELARGLARIYQAEHKLDECIRTLEGAVDKYATRLSCEDITQLGNCYNLRGDFLKTVDLMVQLCKVSIRIQDANDEWNLEKVKSALEQKIKPQFTISLDDHDQRFDFNNRCLLITGLISLGYQDILKPLIDTLDSPEIPSHRQSLYDVAKAYFNQSIYAESKEVLLKLTKHRDSQAASIWLLYSQCLKNLNEIEEAIEGYRKVLSYEPDDYSSRLALANLLSVQGRYDEAIDVTRQPLFTEKPVDVPLLYQSCKLLEQTENWDEYCRSAKALILTDMFYTEHSKEITAMITSKSLRTRLENLRAIQRDLNQDPCTYRQKSVGTKLDSNTMLKTFLRYINILFHLQKDYHEIKKICFSAYTCAAFECYESSIDFYTAVACFISGDKDFTYFHLKTLATCNPDKHQIWNLLSAAMCNIYHDMRHGRFCLRLFNKNPDVMPLALLNGHNALMSGSYKHALGEYMSVYKERPNDSFPAFCVAITFLSLSCQRYVSSKYLCLFQMIAFLHTYLELRGTCQETMYNIGRAFHQMNMLDKAVIFYKRVLSMDGKKHLMTSLEETELTEIYDLKREAAFNLALIYKNSQSYDLAYQVIRDNFRI